MKSARCFRTRVTMASGKRTDAERWGILAFAEALPLSLFGAGGKDEFAVKVMRS